MKCNQSKYKMSKMSSYKSSGNSTTETPMLVMHVDGFQVEIAPETENDDKGLRGIAKKIRQRYNAHEELVDAIESVLIASEDGGDMDDIDWPNLQSLFGKFRK